MGATAKSLLKVPRKVYLPLLALALILIISLGFVIQSKAAQTTATPTAGFKTAVVRRGNIVLSAPVAAPSLPARRPNSHSRLRQSRQN